MGRSTSRDASKSRVESKTPDAFASVSARLGGGMVLIDKEAEGFVLAEPEPVIPRSSGWSAVSKVFSAIQINMSIFERTMQKAWKMHRQANFHDMGSNTFLVHFGSEQDYLHAMHNSHWQYGLNTVVLKDYEGRARPSKMVF